MVKNMDQRQFERLMRELRDIAELLSQQIKIIKSWQKQNEVYHEKTISNM